jgi:hypothetical protein
VNHNLIARHEANGVAASQRPFCVRTAEETKRSFFPVKDYVRNFTRDQTKELMQRLIPINIEQGLQDLHTQETDRGSMSCQSLRNRCCKEGNRD